MMKGLVLTFLQQWEDSHWFFCYNQEAITCAIS